MKVNKQEDVETLIEFLNRDKGKNAKTVDDQEDTLMYG